MLDFLSIEHMNHGGKANGKLLAPRRQLERSDTAALTLRNPLKNGEICR